MIRGMTHVFTFSKMINIAWLKNIIFVIYLTAHMCFALQFHRISVSESTFLLL
jgi:hypothetical protein